MAESEKAVGKKTKKEYEELGKMVASIYESGYLDAKQSYKSSFLKGVFSGLGGVVGATIVVALLVWILTLFGHISFIGRYTDKVKNTVENRQSK
jgi:hypothetical protein